MYPSSSPSSSSQKPMGPTPPTTTTGLTRYGSAPGSLLTTAVDSIIGQTGREFSALRSTPPPPPPSFMAPQQQLHHHHHHHNNSHSQSHHYFSSDSSSITTESTCKVNSSNDPNKDHHKGGGLQRSYGLNEMPSLGDFTSNLKIGGGAGGLSSTSSSSCSSSSSASALVRQRSSPAGFLSHLASDNGTFYFTLTVHFFYFRCFFPLRKSLGNE